MIGIVERAISLLKEKDLAAAIEELSREADPKVFNDCMTELYWKEKNLAASAAIARAGVEIAISRSNGADEAKVLEFKSAAKGLCYNIASFTWDGWDEPGFKISACDLANGLDAAKSNLRYAIELKKGELPLSRAYWMLAGHEISAGQLDQALEHYHEGERHAAMASSKQDVLLNRGFGQMVELLRRPQDAQIKSELEKTKAELKNEKDGEEFVKQIETAFKVFSVK